MSAVVRESSCPISWRARRGWTSQSARIDANVRRSVCGVRCSIGSCPRSAISRLASSRTGTTILFRTLFGVLRVPFRVGNTGSWAPYGRSARCSSEHLVKAGEQRHHAHTGPRLRSDAGYAQAPSGQVDVVAVEPAQLLDAGAAEHQRGDHGAPRDVAASSRAGLAAPDLPAAPSRSGRRTLRVLAQARRRASRSDGCSGPAPSRDRAGAARAVGGIEHRAGFKAVLEATGNIEVVAEAGNGEEAVAAATKHAPDVVLMDIRMPVMDGIEATRRLPRQRVLILTTFGLDEYIIDALRAGASGFLLKDSQSAEILAAVRAVAAGDAVLAPRVTRSCSTRSAAGAEAGAQPTRGARTPRALTDRERQVFDALVPASPTRRSPSELWLSESTVKTHVAAPARSSACATACRP